MTPSPPRMTFPSLEHSSQFAHAFTLRHPTIQVAVDREEALQRLWSWHQEVASELINPSAVLITAEQVHGAHVAVVDLQSSSPIPATDGLISRKQGLLLGIYVADCCAVYLTDPVTGAFGVLHAGRKGAEANITGIAIDKMQQEFGTRPEDLTVQLSPCIRPPDFEIDFAALIREQAHQAGVPTSSIFDEGISTASDLDRFYSYRMEKGRTGRMFALLGRR